MQRGIYLDSEHNLYFIDKINGTFQAQDLQGNEHSLEHLSDLRKQNLKI
jgi:hypothetical protein